MDVAAGRQKGPNDAGSEPYRRGKPGGRREKEGGRAPRAVPCAAEEAAHVRQRGKVRGGGGEGEEGAGKNGVQAKTCQVGATPRVCGGREMKEKGARARGWGGGGTEDESMQKGAGVEGSDPEERDGGEKRQTEEGEGEGKGAGAGGRDTAWSQLGRGTRASQVVERPPSIARVYGSSGRGGRCQHAPKPPSRRRQGARGTAGGLRG